MGTAAALHLSRRCWRGLRPRYGRQPHTLLRTRRPQRLRLRLRLDCFPPPEQAHPLRGMRQPCSPWAGEGPLAASGSGSAAAAAGSFAAPCVTAFTAWLAWLDQSLFLQIPTAVRNRRECSLLCVFGDKCGFVGQVMIDYRFCWGQCPTARSLPLLSGHCHNVTVLSGPLYVAVSPTKVGAGYSSRFCRGSQCWLTLMSRLLVRWCYIATVNSSQEQREVLFELKLSEPNRAKHGRCTSSHTYMGALLCCRVLFMCI